MVNRLSEPLEDFADGRVDYLRIHFDMELALRLFNILLKRVTERFPGVDEWFIIPDQDLFKLPFEALVTGFNANIQQEDVLFSEYRAAEYVIQKYEVSYFFSQADFLRHFSGPQGLSLHPGRVRPSARARFRAEPAAAGPVAASAPSPTSPPRAWRS